LHEAPADPKSGWPIFLLVPTLSLSMGLGAFLGRGMGRVDGGVDFTATVKPVEFVGNEKATGVGA
jgi:hypothetical protein